MTFNFNEALLHHGTVLLNSMCDDFSMKSIWYNSPWCVNMMCLFLPSDGRTLHLDK